MQWAETTRDKRLHSCVAIQPEVATVPASLPVESGLSEKDYLRDRNSLFQPSASNYSTVACRFILLSWGVATYPCVDEIRNNLTHEPYHPP